MKEPYNSAVAHHYSAYRPPLHQSILSRMIDRGETFPIGVDVGCGTGYSTIALAKYCDRVLGVDPSSSMLADAEQHPKVTHVCARGDELRGAAPGPVNIVSFAGSLFYTKSDELRQELANVCSPGAAVVVYDFEVLLDAVLSKMEMPAVGSDYDHAANITDWEEFPATILDSGQVTLELSSEELSHVLLADSNRCEAFSAKLKTQNPFENVVEIPENSSHSHKLNVDIYIARYRYSPV